MHYDLEPFEPSLPSLCPRDFPQELMLREVDLALFLSYRVSTLIPLNATAELEPAKWVSLTVELKEPPPQRERHALPLAKLFPRRGEQRVHCE